MGKIIKFLLKVTASFAIVYCAYTFLPPAAQASVDSALEVPVTMAKQARYTSYFWLCQLFGSNREEALQHAEQYRVPDRSPASTHKY